jgi:carbonic anhydrase/acetyltransferase-like protein (isoleucine patch superfamily)
MGEKNDFNLSSSDPS